MTRKLIEAVDKYLDQEMSGYPDSRFVPDNLIDLAFALTEAKGEEIEARGATAPPWWTVLRLPGPPIPAQQAVTEARYKALLARRSVDDTEARDELHQAIRRAREHYALKRCPTCELQTYSATEGCTVCDTGANNGGAQ